MRLVFFIFAVDCPDTATMAKYTDLSKKLYQVMEDIGVTVKVRNASVRLQRRIEVLQMLLRQPVSSLYIYGSQYEGVNTQSMISDINCVRVLDCPDIVTNLDNAVGTNCLYVINDDIRAGFVELQLVRNGKPLTKEDTSWLTGHTTLRGGFDDENRLVCFPKLTGSHEHEWTGPVSGFWKTKSSLSMKYGLECTIWPVCAATWVSRERKYNWPSQEMVENCKSLGCLIVPPEQDGMQKAYLWEVLFALQERLLITEFNSTQMKCFTLMKLMKAELLSNGNGSEILTSYHCKTCIFYTIENTPSDFWKPKNLVSCLIACWKLFLCWIERAYCPNYFVPARNMFNGLPTEEMRKRGEQIQMILADLNAALARLGTDEIGDRLLQYNNTEPISTEEQRKLTRLYEFRCALPIISMVCCARNSVLNDEFNNKKNVIFENLLKKMQQLTEMQIVKGHTEEETKDVLSLLTKMVQPTLLANCVARKHELGDTPRQTLSSIKSCDYETEKTFNTRNLKKAVMQFEFLDYAGSESLLRPMRWSEKVSICGCKARRSAVPEPEDIDKVTDWMFDVSSEDAMFDVLTPCVVFLPSEIAVTPLPIMYETLRSFGMPPGTRNDQEDYWYDWAVVDGQFLVQFMMWYNEADQGKCWQFGVNLNKMLKVINTGNVSHLETCYNLLGWMCFNEYGLVGLALEFYLRSLSIKPTHNAVYWHLCFLLLKLSQNVILESESD